MNLLKILISLIDRKQKLLYFWCISISIFYSLLESISLALIVPYLNILQNQESGTYSTFVNKIMSYLGSPADYTMLVIYSSFILLLVVAIKTIFQIYQAYLITKIPFQTFSYLSKKLFLNYSNKKYSSLQSYNTNTIIKNVTRTTERGTAAYSIVINIVALFVLSIFLIITMFIVDAIVTISLIVIFSIISLIFYSLLKHKQRTAGIQIEKQTGLLYKIVSESFLNAKEIRIFKTINYFLHKFKNKVNNLSKALFDSLFYPKLPSIFTELTSISIVIFTVIFIVKNNYSLTNVIAPLIFFAAVGKKLVPNINGLTSLFVKLKNPEVSINIIRDELAFGKHLVTANKLAPIEMEIIQIQNLSFSYNKTKNVLNNIDLIIESNKSTAFVGESGSGKSTLIDLLCGLIIHDSGKILLNGKKIDNMGKYDLKIGYVPQIISLLDESIAKNIAFGQNEINVNQLNLAIERANLENLIKDLPNGLETMIGERGIKLSGGQRQRIAIARALYINPNLIIFDEATSSLDKIAQDSVMKTINNLKGEVSIISVAHRINTIKDYDSIYVMHDGKIVGHGKHNYLLENNKYYKKLNY